MEQNHNFAAVSASRVDFRADAAAFHAAAAMLAKLIGKNNIIPILDCIRLEASPAGFVTLSACNLEQFSSVNLPAQVERPGVICTSGPALAAALNKGKRARDEARFSQGDGRAVLTCGRFNFKLGTMPADDFPAPPTSEAEPLAAFELPAGQFLADMATLTPAIGKANWGRDYLQGVAIQPRELAGQARLVFAAMDARNLAVASRPMPPGAENMPALIMPEAVLSLLKDAGRLAGGAELVKVQIEPARAMAAIILQFGPVLITSRAVDGDYPEWPRLLESATPTDENSAPLFPELLPGAPTEAIERMGKACPVPIAWERRGDVFMGSAADDGGLIFAAMRVDLQSAGRKGFSFAVEGEAEARAYLLALAEARGLASPDDLASRCEAINAGWESRGALASAMGSSYGYGSGDCQHGMARADKPSLIVIGGKVAGLTIGGTEWRGAWTETVTNWETLCESEVQHAGQMVAVEGSYSILMPADGPGTLTAVGMGEIIGPDGFAYPVADNGKAIHLSRDQVRALIGESCFEVLEFPGGDGKPRYVAKWLWDDGATRLLLVGKDGRCPKPGAAREYVSRAEIEAALAGGTRTESPAPTSLARCEVKSPAPTSLARCEVKSPATMRERFAALYSRARREGLAGDTLYRAALELTGEPEGACQGPIAARLYTAVERARADVTPMRLHLQRQVLNGWGHGNPLRSPPMESPRFAGWQRQVRRADALRNRLKEAGRLQFDAGNWVQCLIPVKRDKSPENFATMTEYATACAGTPRWFVGRWSDKTRAQYEHRFTPAQWDRLKAQWEAAHSAPESAETPPAAVSEPAMPETALSAPETAPQPQFDVVAALLARVEALESRLSGAPATGGDETAPLPVITDIQENEAMTDTPTPTSVAERPKRTPAHERAIRRAWAERRAVRLALQGCAAFRHMAETTEAEFQQVKAAYDNSGNERRALRKALDDVEGALQRTATKRRRAVLKARDLQRRLMAEHDLVDRANERRRMVQAKLETASRKRRANALMARQRGQEMVTLAKVASERIDQERLAAEAARRSPTYMDEGGRERGDVASKAAYHARLSREQAERLQVALTAMEARAERAEQARDTLADAVESMGTRLANAEAAVRRMNAA